MNVKCDVDIYEIDDKEVSLGKPNPVLKVSSHWNRHKLVVIQIEGKEYTVIAAELLKAIENATNWKVY